MAIKVGLVGLPNVGKSTLFNALTKSTIAAQNFPFCTINPNIAITPIPDKRLAKLQKFFNSEKIIPCSINIVDIAGLVKGASAGEGLGNQFLSHIMETDVIIHVLRCFEDGNILHVNNKISPLEDFEIITAELMLKDSESLDKRIIKLGTLIKKADVKTKKGLQGELAANTEIKKALDDFELDKAVKLANDAKEAGVELQPLLSTKKFLIAANFSEQQMQNKAFENEHNYKILVEKFGKARIIPVSAKIEEDLSKLSDEEQLEMRVMLELDETGLNQLINKTYQTLDRMTYFTCGPKEIHAWSIKNGTAAPEAAGEIHTDLERGFICVEVYNYTDLDEMGSEQAIKNAGKLRVEGRDYIFQDGDIVHVRFNV